MKKLIFILCLCSTVSIAFGQVKVSLSYQYISPNTNYIDNENNGVIYIDNGNTGTIQANVIWQFLPYLSAFTGLGYNSRSLSLNNTDTDKYLGKEFGYCATCFPNGLYSENNFDVVSDIEIPLGIRFNTPSLFNFEMGLSIGMTGVITTSETENYNTDYLFDCVIDPNEVDQTNALTRSSSFSSRLDVALDIQYNLGLAWQISLAGTWSPYDLETNNSSEIRTHEAGSRVNGQKGVRLGIIRSF